MTQQLMAWETRNGYGPYYTRTRRVGSRFVREYCGAGLIGEACAALDAEQRAEREVERQVRRAQQAEAREVSDALADMEALTRQVIADTLHVEGFHRHKGQWRRRGAAEG